MFNQENCFGGFAQMGNYMMSGGGIMFIGLILIIGVVIFLFSKNTQNVNNQSPYNEGALDILKKRFANSEISEDEYLAKKSALSK